MIGKIVMTMFSPGNKLSNRLASPCVQSPITSIWAEMIITEGVGNVASQTKMQVAEQTQEF